MNVYKAIEKRRSIRNYKPTPVPEEKLEKILEAARLAPSANNLQPRHFIVVTNAEKRKALSGGMYAKFLKRTPVVIAACGDEKTAPEWYAIDVAIAVENMVLAATGEGLGTCWIGSFDENQVRDTLKIPQNLRVIVLLAVGYPRDRKSLTSKASRMVRELKPLEEIVSLEEYGKAYEKTQTRPTRKKLPNTGTSPKQSGTRSLRGFCPKRCTPSLKEKP
jgi:nitroreductase